MAERRKRYDGAAGVHAFLRRNPLPFLLIFTFLLQIHIGSVEASFVSTPLFPLKHGRKTNLGPYGVLDYPRLLSLGVVSPQPSNEPELTDRHKVTEKSNESSDFFSEDVLPVVLFLLQSFLVTILLVSWEDLTCSYTLPSRQTTSLLRDGSWGTSTVRGLAFGKAQRLNLDERDDLLELIPSFNEIGLKHRQERVPRWKSNVAQEVDAAAVSQAAHTLLDCLQTIQNLQVSAADYQWDTVREQLRAPPLSQLEPAASTLRRVVDQRGEAVVGFDWASCAWRHCGALADAQEALDEVEHLLGVLEPFEAIFCLDIVERSLRDILTAVPWDKMNQEDAQRWKAWPQYVPRTSQNAVNEDGLGSSIDDEYFQALQDFRID